MVSKEDVLPFLDFTSIGTTEHSFSIKNSTSLELSSLLK